MFSKDTIFKTVTEVGGKAFEFGKSAADTGLATISTTIDAAKEKVMPKVDLDLITVDLLKAVEETKPEHLASRFKEVLERHL